MKNRPSVAYFCMEYGIESDFKLYAGGLGILTGDYLKGAKDGGYPLVGLGIKWKQGYTDQLINEEGNPYDAYTSRTYDFLVDTGVEVIVRIRRSDVKVKVWKSEAWGTNPLYLLDTDVDGNSGEDRWITGQLYGWFKEERLAQEIVLGMGGVKALRALNIPVDVYHFNEGHAVLASMELIGEKMYSGMSFEEAWQASRRETVFTTHTPVIQGNESHELDTMAYMGAFRHLRRDQMERIGGDPFNMTVAALRLSCKSNAVAQLHAETANTMWQTTAGRSEIVGITNCIHRPTWVDQRIIRVRESGESLLTAHQIIKKELIEFIILRSGVRLDPEKLLIGFSRRAAPYKRSDLIFRDTAVIEPLLHDGRVQLVFSGRAHPLDDEGKAIVSNLAAMMRKYPNAVVFLENYDMNIGRMLTRGSDVWLNNPRRPMEASGTSGMKAAMNGVLNCSVLDGWWPEACEDGVNGWQIGAAFESEDPAEQDAHDQRSLMRVLTEKIIPLYYGDKTQWEKMMRASIDSTFERFGVEVMLENYYEQLYSV